MQDLRGAVLAQPAGEPPSFDEVPAVPEAGAETDLAGEFADEAEAAIDFGREAGGLYGAQTGGERRVRAAVKERVGERPVRSDVQLRKWRKTSILRLNRGRK